MPEAKETLRKKVYQMTFEEFDKEYETLKKQVCDGKANEDENAGFVRDRIANLRK
jgi:hypothetical protein